MISSALLRTVMNYGPVINDTWLRQPTDRESGTNWFQTMCKSVDGFFCRSSGQIDIYLLDKIETRTEIQSTLITTVLLSLFWNTKMTTTFISSPQLGFQLKVANFINLFVLQLRTRVRHHGSRLEGNSDRGGPIVGRAPENQGKPLHRRDAPDQGLAEG